VYRSFERSVGMRGVRQLGPAIALAALLGSATGAGAGECSNDFDSTYDAIQTVIFDQRGCSIDACHGAAASGGLDLRAGASYDQLVSQSADTANGWLRVRPGEKDRSLLFINLAAKTLPDDFTAPLRAMPLDPLPALSTNELEAIRKWIEAGAPRDSVITGTADLLDACLPPPKPIEIEPLPPPAPGTGVQIRMPRWIVEKDSETEVCFASYYDVTDQVPEQFRGPNGTFRYNLEEIRQDPLSHHLIVNLYEGASAPQDPVWGTFKCRAGAKEGEVCNPLAIGFCGDGECANDAFRSIACFNQPNLPGDSGLGINASGFTGTQETATTIDLAPGVYAELPMKGMIIWNSHAFNVTDQDGKLDAWLNFHFAPPDEQRYPLNQIFDSSEIFTMNVPAFTAQEVCNVHELPPNAKLFELSSHMHQRGKRWRTFAGAWRCDGGRNAGAACSPYGPDVAYDTPDICAGAPCRAPQPPDGGDCNADLAVTIDELVLGVGIALGNNPVDQCLRADLNEDGALTIDEIVKAVKSAGEGAGDRDADESLMYTSFIYNDPIVLQFEPPLAIAGTHSLPPERSLTYCAVYDNGAIDMETVKRKSTSPPTPLGIPGLFGGPCATPTGCTEGRVGAVCSGTNAQQLNASCDTAPGAGDGLCDACPLLGGVTTEDEMFLFLGSFFVAR